MSAVDRLLDIIAHSISHKLHFLFRVHLSSHLKVWTPV